MTITDSPTLTTLIEAYDKAVVFEESVPNHFLMAKMFTEMRWSNGGLVLLGVKPDGQIIGVEDRELDMVYEKFGSLCRDLTETLVEMGTLRVAGRLVVFLVFNTIPRNLSPLEDYSGAISRVELI